MTAMTLQATLGASNPDMVVTLDEGISDMGGVMDARVGAKGISRGSGFVCSGLSPTVRCQLTLS